MKCKILEVDTRRKRLKTSNFCENIKIKFELQLTQEKPKNEEFDWKIDKFYDDQGLPVMDFYC